MLQKIIEKILKFWARRVLLKQKPRIVTVTGSVGKSSTKEAIYAVLSSRFRVRRSRGNYNNEIGVPLTILGAKKSPAKNLLLWKGLFIKAFVLSLFENKNYPEILVLEIGADKPGDLKYLMEMLPSNLLKAAVLTAVAPVHLEFFGTMQNILQEKTTPFKYLPEDGKAIVNQDCVNYKEADIYYGLRQAGDLASQFVFPHQAYAPLAGIAVGRVFGIRKEKAKQAIAENYKTLAGRGRKIQGINNSILIDDTYNASPLSTRAALRAVANLPYAKRKIAVLGDMLELGPQSPEFHKRVGEIAAELEFNCLITYGQEAKNIAPGTARHFESQEKLIEFLKNIIQPGDVILIKGSQGARMEKITKALMKEPEKAKELLVRQSKKWLKK